MTTATTSGGGDQRAQTETMHRVALPLVRTAARRPSLAWIHADPAAVAVSGADDGRGGGGRVWRQRDDGGQERRRVIPGLGLGLGFFLFFRFYFFWFFCLRAGGII